MKQKRCTQMYSTKEAKYLYNKLMLLKYEETCLYDKFIYITFMERIIRLTFPSKLCCTTNLKINKVVQKDNSQKEEILI